MVKRLNPYNMNILSTAENKGKNNLVKHKTPIYTMSTYTTLTKEESKEMNTKFLQRRIDAYQNDVDYLNVEYLKAVSTNNIVEGEDCQRALVLAEAVLRNAKVTLRSYLNGKPFINN